MCMNDELCGMMPTQEKSLIRVQKAKVILYFNVHRESQLGRVRHHNILQYYSPALSIYLYHFK